MHVMFITKAALPIFKWVFDMGNVYLIMLAQIYMDQ